MGRCGAGVQAPVAGLNRSNCPRRRRGVFLSGGVAGGVPPHKGGRLRPTAPMDDSIWVADTWARLWLGPKSNSLDALCEYFRRSFFDH